MTENVLMVCVGNICRSPIAEALWNHRLTERGLPPMARSTGLSARLGDSIHPVSAQLLLERGIASTEHRARPVRTTMLKEADLVLVMEDWHRSRLQDGAPFARGRIYTLGHWHGVQIPDPMGEPEEVFRLAFDLIEQGVSEWLRRLNIIGAS